MTPTERIAHALDSCPDCGTPLAGGWVQRTREVIEIPVVPAQVTEHAFVTRASGARCKRRQMPPGALPGVAAGQQRFGTNLVSLIATLRDDLRLPIAAIQRYLRSVHELPVSQGGIVEVLHGVARRVKPAVDAVREQVRGSPVVHGDETGWRQDGANGYVWTFSTPTERYFLRRGRNKEVVDEVLDESFGGVLVSDFYAAYNHYPGLKQRCWAHLLRDIHDLKELYPEDAALRRWAEAIHQLYTQAKAVISRKISGGTRSAQGTDSKMTLASLFGTWRARGLNPFQESRALLAAPQL